MQPQHVFYLIVLLGAILVFVADSIGNRLSFKNRIINALTTAIVWGALFIGLYFVLNAFEIQLAGSLEGLMKLALKGAAIVFVADMIGNLIAFGNRFVNSFVTAVVWAGIFLGLNAVGLV